MTTSPSEVIQRRLSDLMSGPDNELKSAASLHHALPVYSDLGGTLFITSELKVLMSQSDDSLSIVPESSEDWRLVALVSASEKFPALRCLLPARPADMPQCAQCGGSGKIKQFRCGECFGLGWQSLRYNK
jgi:hypothetical protein